MYADVFVDVPEELDLSMLKGSGPQGEEELLPEGEEPKKAPEPNAAVVAQLQMMGFPELHCKKAALNSGTLGCCLHGWPNELLDRRTHQKPSRPGNSDPEAAMNWLLSHMDDPDLDKPLESSSAAPSGGASGGESVNEEAVMILSSMGFTRDQVLSRSLSRAPSPSPSPPTSIRSYRCPIQNRPCVRSRPPTAMLTEPPTGSSATSMSWKLLSRPPVVVRRLLCSLP